MWYYCIKEIRGRDINKKADKAVVGKHQYEQKEYIQHAEFDLPRSYPRKIVWKQLEMWKLELRRGARA